MRLLMLTRKVNREDSSPAGFTYTWVKKLGEKLDKLYVITWQKSDRGNLPENIEIFSLPESKLFKIFVLQFYLLKLLPRVNGIFCHQNPEYAILTAPLAKIFRKRLTAWYTHGSVSWRLKLVNLLSDQIITASKESCRLKNRQKIEITGHGIDLDYFRPVSRESNGKFRIVSIGRISPAKDYETLIKAVDKIDNLEVKIIGGPVLKKDEIYFQNLKKIAGKVKLLGPIPHNRILPYYQNHDLFINLSRTGSLDKAVLEAMACECLILTSNEAFKSILKDERLLFEQGNYQNLAEKIINLMNLNKEEKKKIGRRLKEEIIKNHSLNKLTEKILFFYEK